MIIVKLWGGMCNQLFQYAFGYALAKETTDDLAFDIEFYRDQPKNVKEKQVEIQSSFSTTRFKTYPRPKEVEFFENRYVNKVIRIFHGFPIVLKKQHFFYKEWMGHYCERIPYHVNYKNYYDGYWQTSKYFYKYRSEILKEFKPPEQVLSDVKRVMKSFDNKNTVAVHVRRGDFLNGKNSGGFTEEGLCAYYRCAMDYIAGQIDDPLFCFISDDMEWCRKTYASIGYSVVFLENTGEKAALTDLFCISECKHGIMSPSTFSWWGNWLRENLSSSIVIAPKGSYGNDHFLEDTWITI